MDLSAVSAAVELGLHIEHYPVDARIATPNGGRYLVADLGHFDEGERPGIQHSAGRQRR